MGATGRGIEIHGEAIRLNFFLDGKRQRHILKVNGKSLPPTPANLKYANRIIQEIRERIRYGTFSLSDYFTINGPTGSLTVKDWLEAWKGTLAVEDSTKDGYRAAINFWNAVIGDKVLKYVRLSEMLKAIAMHKHLSGKTLNNYISVLRQALDLAVEDNVITENPALKIPLQKYQKPQPDPFSKEEVELIIEKMGRYPEPIVNMVEFWMFTGLRTSEIFGLRWENIDLRTNSMVIKEANVRGKQKTSTKTNVERHVMLNSRAQEALKRQEKHTRMAGDHVFRDSRYETPWNEERAFRRSYWQPCMKLLGIRYRRPYNMRHTYATMMLMAGMTPAFCAKQLGHGIEVFLRTYSKWLDGAQNEREMERLEQSFETKTPQKRPKNLKNIHN